MRIANQEIKAVDIDTKHFGPANVKSRCSEACIHLQPEPGQLESRSCGYGSLGLLAKQRNQLQAVK